MTVKGERLAVVSATDWEVMIEWLETLEDIKIAQDAFAALKAAGGIANTLVGYAGKMLKGNWGEPREIA